MRIWEWTFGLLLFVAFVPAVVAMLEVWSRLDYQSHGFLVPLVSLWIAASRRRMLRGIAGGHDLRGLLLVMVASAGYGCGLAASVVWLQGLALVVAVAGAVLYLRGEGWLRVLGFPIAFLVFMIPLPQAAIGPITLKLQLFVSATGAGLLQAAGVSVFRDGNVIELPGGQSLFVAEACSGITSIVTLLPLAVILAYFSQRSFARRAVLVGLVVPVAVLGNLIRVIATVLVARSFGIDVATGGFLHESAGLFTYALGCLLLLAIGMLMRHLVPEQRAISTP